MTGRLEPLSIRSDLSELERLFSYVGRFCARHGLSDDTKHDVLLAAEELMVNAIEHGYGGRPDGRIDVGLACERSRVELVMADDAPRFDPLSSAAPRDLRSSIHDRDIGGLGLHLVKALAEAVDYRFDGGRNIIRVLFRIR